VKPTKLLLYVCGHKSYDIEYCNIHGIKGSVVSTVFVYCGFLSRGIEAVVVDYVRPITFGNVIPKIALGALYLLSIVTLAGLLFFITNDVGIVLAIKQFWKL
jgi:hypothetical protein